MARIERYIDNVNGNDSWDGSSPVYQGGTIGPWLTLDKACGTNPGSGNYFAVYLKNNNDLSQKIVRPYYRTGSYLFHLRYGGLDANQPMEFHLNGSWLTGGTKLEATWEKVPGTSYVYRCYLPGVSNLPGLYAWGDDCYQGLSQSPRALVNLGGLGASNLRNIPWDNANHSYYWDGTNKYLYLCDWSGNPNATGLYLEYPNATTLIYCASSSVKYHKFINGIFYNTTNNITSATYDGLSIERCYLYNEFGYDFGLNLRNNSLLCYSVVFARSTAMSTNCVVRIDGINTRIYNNILYGSSYGLRLLSGATAAAYNNIFLGQYIAAFKFDGEYGAGLTADYNAIGCLELDAVYGNCLGKLPGPNDQYQFPGNSYGIFDKVFRYDGNSYQDITAAAANDDGNDFPLMGSSSHQLYLGSRQPFTGLLMELRTAGAYSGLTLAYFNGESWQTSYTLRGQTGLDAKGCVLAFNMPFNWVKTSVNGSEPLYWIRLAASTVNTMAVAKYARINGSFWEYFSADRDAFNLMPTSKININNKGYDWGYRGVDLAGKSVKIPQIGPYNIDTVSKTSNYIEIEAI